MSRHGPCSTPSHNASPSPDHASDPCISILRCAASVHVAVCSRGAPVGCAWVKNQIRVPSGLGYFMAGVRIDGVVRARVTCT